MAPTMYGSGQDSPLSTAANIMGIMTFAFAVFFGIHVRVQLVKRSRKEMRRMFIDLDYSLHQLSGSMRLCDDTLRALEPGDGVRHLRAEFDYISSRMEDQLRELIPWIEKMEQQQRRHTKRLKRWTFNLRFAIGRDELVGKIAEKDKLRDEARRFQDKINAERDAQGMNPSADDLKELLIQNIEGFKKIERYLPVMERKYHGHGHERAAPLHWLQFREQDTMDISNMNDEEEQEEKYLRRPSVNPLPVATMPSQFRDEVEESSW